MKSFPHATRASFLIITDYQTTLKMVEPPLAMALWHGVLLKSDASRQIKILRHMNSVKTDSKILIQ